ncbi:MAG: hypothetical protein LBP95_02930 [Deltaproteobacteria bacterium]|jgi:hypothetical protein|nr:hypothetical protein [Deltaproteobacteria bacterium]
MTYARPEARIGQEIITESADGLDVLVGIVADPQTGDVLYPLTKAHEGLALACPGQKTAVALCACSEGGRLREDFLAAPCPAPRIYQAAAPGAGSKVQNLFNLMFLAKRTGARAVIVLDADLPSVKRTWIARLAAPILSGQADYTAPFYHSLNFDTPVTNLYGYPMFRAVFGRRLRQPFYTDRAFSKELNDYFLSYEKWPTELPYAAAELTMAVLTVGRGARICQSFLATPRVHWQNSPLGLNAGADFRDIAGCLLPVVADFFGLWGQVKRSRPTPVTGTELTPSIIAPRQVDPPEVFAEEIQRIAGLRKDLWREAFDGRKDWLFQKITSEPPDELGVAPEDWAYVCMKSVAAFRRLGPEDKPGFVEALSAVFFARLLGWLKNGAGLSLPQMEALTEEECRLFEANRPRLIADWAALG